MPEHDLTPLCELAKKYETDKGGWHYRYGGGDSDTCHNYTPAYHFLFKDRRDDVRKVLEIGVNAGSSLRMWEEYFPRAFIWGLDIRKEVIFAQGRINCVFADQGDPKSLLQAMETISMLSGDTGPPRFELIIDDGSHEYGHQIVSLQTLLPYLTDNGVYVVEDTALDCQPQIIGDQVPKGYRWFAAPVGHGIGKAHCDPGCPYCHGESGENLILIVRDR